MADFLMNGVGGVGGIAAAGHAYMMFAPDLKKKREEKQKQPDSPKTESPRHLSTTSTSATSPDDEGLGSRSPALDRTRSSTASEGADSARGLSGLYGPIPPSPNPSTTSRPLTAHISPDDYLSQMLGDLHVSYKGYDSDQSPTRASAAEGDEGKGWSSQDGSDELDAIFDSYYGVSVADESKAQRMERNRAKAVAEIVNTEGTYVEMLTSLVELVVLPLRELLSGSNAKKLGYTGEDLNKIFCNVEEIRGLHVTLLDGLRERHSVWTNDTKISDMFMTIVPFLKMYQLYMSMYANAVETLTRCRKSSSDMNRIITAAENHPRFKGLQILSFLILPIQRIPRYILLLEQLVHYTAESHPDYADLTLCVTKVRQIADHINDELRKFEERKKVIEIASKVVGRPATFPVLVTPARRFLLQGELLLPMLMSADRRIVFLFTDLLVITKRSKDGALYEFKEEVDLWEAWVKSVDDQTGSAKPKGGVTILGSPTPTTVDQVFPFHIVANNRSVVLATTTIEDRARWVEAIEHAITNLQNGGVRRHGTPEPLMLANMGPRASLGSNPSPTNWGRRGSASLVQSLVTPTHTVGPPSSPSAMSFRSVHSSSHQAHPHHLSMMSQASSYGSGSSSPMHIPYQAGSPSTASYAGSFVGQSPPPRRGSIAPSRASLTYGRSFEAPVPSPQVQHGAQPPLPPMPGQLYHYPSSTMSHYPVAPPDGGRLGVGHSQGNLVRSRSVDVHLAMYGSPAFIAGQEIRPPPASAQSPYPSMLDPTNPNFVGSQRATSARGAPRNNRSKNGGSDAGNGTAKDLIKSHGF
ncbi:hypothetical protein BCR44DRAFT_1495741 [Catenaria anguillulae PL171]|uniref:Dbl homology domain-containing protein n=1 Tax=Catenaria anguillulae PL171 TaxID=765915 RepID=A0A1Y2I4J9_9FUNG|nr:hypothetical protein BCR44DRAFT_1495741 [Catenaria anguillulae PL171]